MWGGLGRYRMVADTLGDPTLRRNRGGGADQQLHLRRPGWGHALRAHLARRARNPIGQFTGGTGKYAGVVSAPFTIMAFPALDRPLDGYNVSAGIKIGTYAGGTPPAR